MIHYKKFPFIELQEKLPCSSKPSRNSSHELSISNTNFPSQFINEDFCIIFKSVRGSIVSTMTRIYAGRYGVQNLARARKIRILQNIQTSFSTHPALNPINLYRPNVPYMERSLYAPIYGRDLCVALRMH
jgi:hypothetical protein